MISRATVFDERDVGADVRGRARRRRTGPCWLRRGSTTNSRAPLRTPASTWWKKIGWASRAFEPHITMTSVSSISAYDDVPPPAPNTVARPTTQGACQVRLQESMLLVPMTARANFWAM